MQGSANSSEFMSYKFIWINVYLTPMSTKSSLDRPNRDSGYPGTVRTQSEIHPKIDFLSICQGSYDRLGTVCSSVSCKSQNLFWWNFSTKKMSISSKNRWNRKVFFFFQFSVCLASIWLAGRFWDKKSCQCCTDPQLWTFVRRLGDRRWQTCRCGPHCL